MNKIRRSLKKLVTFTLLMLCAFVDTQKTCTTLRKETGVCVPVSQCKTVSNQIAKNRLTASLKAFIEKSKCAEKNGNDEYMCCDTSKATMPKTRELSKDNIEHGLAILQATKCGSTGSPRVAGGTNAKLCEYRWMAQLVYNTNGKSTVDCAGSLISAQYVLTAAHCIKGLEDNLVSVLLGNFIRRRKLGMRKQCIWERGVKKCAPQLQQMEIEDKIYHPSFHGDFKNDIGLIRLAGRAIENECVQPICLPITPSSQIMPEKLKVAGWGLTESGVQANILQVAEIPVKDMEYCSSKHLLTLDKALHFCVADYFAVQACLGDSGGPIFNIVKYNKGARHVQYGIVSFGSTECGSKYPGIDVRIITFVDWIAANLQD